MKNPEQPSPPFIDWSSAPKEGPLHGYGGAKPPAPKWFDDALAQEPERKFIPVHGAQIETLAWGERGKPGLLLMHGNGAHADWWSFFAPFFADRFRVGALSWSGMGNSEWRKEYRLDVFADEALAAAEATGVFDGPVKPVFMAHSFGALMLRYIAMTQGERLGGAIVLDSRTDMMGRNANDGEERRPPPRKNPNRIYPALAEALDRFRLAPPQTCENLYAVDYIARRALREVPLPEGGGTGWQWKFDPHIFGNMVARDGVDFTGPTKCPMAMIWGARSLMMDSARLKAMRNMEEGGGPMIEIPDAGHHVWLDQPLALVTALAALLETWPKQR